MWDRGFDSSPRSAAFIILYWSIINIKASIVLINMKSSRL